DEFERRAFIALALPPQQQALLRFTVLIGTLDNRNLPPAANALIEELRGVIGTYADVGVQGA
ncbi:MAG: hypothetical protein ACPHUF_10820, partial [Gammaproteobacteria bacterium]